MPVAAKNGAPWTEEEDLLLAKHQAVYGNKWAKVSNHIPGRTGQSCAQRWRHKVNPNIVKDKWTVEEDSTLIELVGKLGIGKWAKVARHLPGRTDQQCMGRWRRHLDPSIRKDAWTAEEDALLQELHQELGSSWSCIAKQIANRTPQQCRGRWCILTGLGKNKMLSPAAPETPHPDRARSRKGPGATAVIAFAARQGQQGPACPSTISRRGAVTEMPAMPASATGQPQSETQQPPTVQQARRTRATARASTATGMEPLAAAAAHTMAIAVPATQVRQRVRRLPVLDQGLAEQQPEQELQEDGEDGEQQELQPLSESEGESESQESQEDSEQDDGVAGLHSGARRGRLVLGRRLVSFRTRPRSTLRRPHTRMALVSAIVVSAAGSPLGARNATSRPAGHRVSAAAAAVALLSPPRGTFALCDVDDDDEAAMLNGLLDDDGDEQDEEVKDQEVEEEREEELQQQDLAVVTDGTRSGAAAGGAAGCSGPVAIDVPAPRQLRTLHRRAASTDSRSATRTTSVGCSGRSVDADAEAAMAAMSTRITRSGRTYPLTTSTSMTATSGGGGCSGAGPVSESQRRGNRPSPTGLTATATTTDDASHGADAELEDAPMEQQHGGTVALAAGAGGSDGNMGSHDDEDGDEDEGDMGMLSDDESEAAGAAEAVEAAAAAAAAAVGGGGAVGGPLLHNVDSPLPLQMVGRRNGHLLSGGSTRSSFGLPDALLGAGGAVAGHAASPGDQPADWHQVVGSPPTSSLLALLQAGLLQTPTGTPGGSPGPGMLRAPIAPGMPQVTPGMSNEWSEVPALSWSEWRNINGGFGILTRQPAAACASAQGTPDNTRLAPRAAAEGTRGMGFTPRRDMFVRCHTSAAAGGSPRPAAFHVHDSGSVDAEGEGEGYGGTRSLLTSPSGSFNGHPSRLRRCANRRASADEVVLERDARLRLEAGCGADMAAAMNTATGLPRPHSARGGTAHSPCQARLLGMTTSADGVASQAHGPQPLPDFCSPSKKQRMATSEPGAAPHLPPGLGYVGLPGPTGLSAAGSMCVRLPPAPRLGSSLPTFLGGTSSSRPSGLLDNLPSNVRSGRDSGLQTSLFARLQAVEQANAATAACAATTQAPVSSALPLPLPFGLDGTSPHPTMAPTAATQHQSIRPPPTAPHIPIPPALARALMPPPAARARQFSMPQAPVLQHLQAQAPHLQRTDDTHMDVSQPVARTCGGNGMGVAGGCSAGVVSFPAAGPLGLPRPLGLPPLALPKLPPIGPGGPQQFLLTSMFPVLTLNRYQQQSDKENSMS